jgi:hypothetical protein
MRNVVGCRDAVGCDKPCAGTPIRSNCYMGCEHPGVPAHGLSHPTDGYFGESDWLIQDSACNETILAKDCPDCLLIRIVLRCQNVSVPSLILPRRR